MTFNTLRTIANLLEEQIYFYSDALESDEEEINLIPAESFHLIHEYTSMSDYDLDQAAKFAPDYPDGHLISLIQECREAQQKLNLFNQALAEIKNISF